MIRKGLSGNPAGKGHRDILIHVGIFGASYAGFAVYYICVSFVDGDLLADTTMPPSGMHANEPEVVGSSRN